VTVCITAISAKPTFGASQGPYIVMISDTMISGPTLSADMVTVKAEPFHADWIAMMAGEDITQCVPIIDKAGEYFQGRKNTLAVARSVFKRAFQRHAIEMREDAVLSTYGMKMEDFLKSGKRKFTEKQFNSLYERMNTVTPGCEFLVTGFDEMKRPHIFHVSSSGIDNVYDKVGFGAIGSGQWAAETILYALGQNTDRNIYDTIYNVCAAKFMAERASGVGRESYLYARIPGSVAFSHSYSMLGRIRDAWEKQGCPKMPEGIAETIAASGMNFYTG